MSRPSNKPASADADVQSFQATFAALYEAHRNASAAIDPSLRAVTPGIEAALQTMNALRTGQIDPQRGAKELSLQFLRIHVLSLYGVIMQFRKVRADLVRFVDQRARNDEQGHRSVRLLGVYDTGLATLEQIYGDIRNGRLDRFEDARRVLAWMAAENSAAAA